MANSEAFNMKKRPIDLERAIVAHHQALKIAQPCIGALDDPTTLIPPRPSHVLRGRSNAIRLGRRPCQRSRAEFLSWSPRMMGSAYADRRERRFREPDFRRGCRVKVVSQRNTAAVDYHHPLRPLTLLGFPDSGAPFFLPEQNCRPEMTSSTAIA